MKTPAADFVDTLDKKDYKELIAWARREIKEYERFIRLLERKMGNEESL